MIRFKQLKRICSECRHDNGGGIDQEEVFTCEKCGVKTQARWPPLKVIQQQLRQGRAWVE